MQKDGCLERSLQPANCKLGITLLPQRDPGRGVRQSIKPKRTCWTATEQISVNSGLRGLKPRDP